MVSPVVMPGPHPDQAYSLLESSFQQAPLLKSHKPLPRRSNDYYSVFPAAAPIKTAVSFSDDETSSQVSYQDSKVLAPPPVLNGTDTGLPPTPPSNSQDDAPPVSFSPPQHADGVVSSLITKTPSLSTPINQRSPPTPDPSPPRTTESMTSPERPPIYAYPSSRADSFKTAREEQLSSDGGSQTHLPLHERLSTVAEDRGLGLAFELDDKDATPRNSTPKAVDEALEEKRDGRFEADDIPNREWDTNLMRNVTVRRKRGTRKQKILDSLDTTSSGTNSTIRQSSGLRESVDENKPSPRTPNMENFAHSIGWPSEVNSMLNEHIRNVDPKRLSGASTNSTVVEAMVIVTPPRRRQTLRHTGKNLVLRRGGDSAEHSPRLLSNRNSLNSEDIPLHRLVHKRSRIPDRMNRQSGGSDNSATDPFNALNSSPRVDQEIFHRTSSPLRTVSSPLQPPAEIKQTGPGHVHSLSRSHRKDIGHHKRIVSAPMPSSEPRTFLELSPPESPKHSKTSSMKIAPIATSWIGTGPSSQESSPTSPRLRRTRRVSNDLPSPLNLMKSLPALPKASVEDAFEPAHSLPKNEEDTDDHRSSTYQLDVARQQLCSRDGPPQEPSEQPQSSPMLEPQRTVSVDTVPTIQEPPAPQRERSDERRQSMSRARSSTSQVPTEEIPRQSVDWVSLRPEDHRRLSFDRSSSQTEEHAMARHLFSQSTPFSQLSAFSENNDALEVSEATAVSIYPHNNHSLLVVQQVARSNTLPSIHRHFSNESDVHSSPPSMETQKSEPLAVPPQPTLTFEPSTPPLQKSALAENVDSPLKNPRQAPEPPIIQFIPPTPAEELERQLPPGPPIRTDSRPVRRLSLVQRARRYSDNVIAPLLARASSNHRRVTSDSHIRPGAHHVPNVNEEDGSLHPFWRPRGFWEGFEDSDTESEDDELPPGGDTSDIPEVIEDPIPPKTGLGSLSRRLTNGLKPPGGFLIGNSLGVERAGTNRRRPHIELPSLRRRASRPKIMVQAPTFPTSLTTSRVEKSGSRNSMRSSGSYEYRHRPTIDSRRQAWRKGKSIPGLRGMQVQYIGLSGVKEKIKERRERKWERNAEKRREVIRRSIGQRYYVDDSTAA